MMDTYNSQNVNKKSKPVCIFLLSVSPPACLSFCLPVPLPVCLSELLWTAPELLRNPVRGGTYAGDVFSFSVIIQEVISRTLPYAMMDMPAHGKMFSSSLSVHLSDMCVSHRLGVHSSLITPQH